MEQDKVVLHTYGHGMQSQRCGCNALLLPPFLPLTTVKAIGVSLSASSRGGEGEGWE